MSDRNIYISQYFKNVFNSKIIDSFRPRYSNAHIILEELLDTCKLVEKNIISNYYLLGIIEEAIILINDDVILNQNKNIKRKNFLLKKLSLAKGRTGEIDCFIQFLKSELVFMRKKYLNFLKEEIFLISDKRKRISGYSCQKIRRLLSSFISECMFIGISFKSLKMLGSLKKEYSKTDIKRMIDKILNKKLFNFYLILFGVDKDAISFFVKTFKNKKDSLFLVHEKWPTKTIPSAFISEMSKRKYVVFEIRKKKFLDCYGGLLEIRTALEPIVSIVHIFYPKKQLYFFNKGFVIDYSSRKKNSSTINYMDVVNYQCVNSEKIDKKIFYCFNLSEDIQNKMFNSASYLNISLNEFNIINKYLNAWVSIEVIFNTVKNDSGDAEGKTVGYINEFVPKIFSIFYISKIIGFLFQRVLDLKLDVNEKFIINNEYDVVGFLEYLKKEENKSILFDKLVDQKELRETLFYFIDIIFDNKKLSKLLDDHRGKILFHLQRLYRLRNILIHGGEKNIKADGLYNISSIAMLCTNCQEYSTQLISCISEIYVNLSEKYKEDKLTMFNVLNFFSVLYDKIVYKLNNNDFDFSDLKKMFSPIDFIE